MSTDVESRPMQRNRLSASRPLFRVADVLPESDWLQVVEVLQLSPAQAKFLWEALNDPRERSIAKRMGLSVHGAHSHRVSLFRKLAVDCMPAAIARVFAAYLALRRDLDTQGSLRSLRRTPSGYTETGGTSLGDCSGNSFR